MSPAFQTGAPWPSGALLLLLQDASDEEAALEADLMHIRWAIAKVQRSIAAMPPEPPPRGAASCAGALGTDTLGLDDSALAAGTERSLGAIDAAMRARGYRCPGINCTP
jgi:hypothetical protein